MEVQLGRGRLHGAAELDVEVARPCPAPGPPGGRPRWRRDRAPRRARRTTSSTVEEVALLGAVVAGEGAEAARLDAHVGEVDVAVDDVGHLVAGLLGAAARRRWRGARRDRAPLHRAERRPPPSTPSSPPVEAGLEERRGSARSGAGEERRQVAAHDASAPAGAGSRQVAPGRRQRARRRRGSPGAAGRRASRAVEHSDRRWARRGRSAKPGAAQAPRSALEVRPGVARVDVVGRHRRDAAEVVDAGLDSSAVSSAC